MRSRVRSPLRPSQLQTKPDGTTDALYYYHILGKTNKLDKQGRLAWIALINSFQNATTGHWYSQSFERWAGLFPWHTSATAVTALYLLGGQPAHPTHFATDIALNRSAWAPWLDFFLNASATPRPGHDPTTDDRVMWHSSHALAAVPCVLNATATPSSAPFLQWYFDQLTRRADPLTGNRHGNARIYTQCIKQVQGKICWHKYIGRHTIIHPLTHEQDFGMVITTLPRRHSCSSARVFTCFTPTNGSVAHGLSQSTS